VNVTSLSSVENTLIYLYYGNNNCNNQENIDGVWNNNYHGVWHLNEISGPVYDSTSYSNDGSANGVNQDTVGIIDGADDFERISNSNGDYVSIPSDPSLNLTDELTLETWVKFYDTSPSAGRQSILGRFYTNYEMSILFDLLSPHQQAFTFYKYGIMEGNYDQVKYYFTPGEITADTWHHLVATMDGYTMKLYFDGVIKNSSIGTYDGTVSNDNYLDIGRRTQSNTQYVNGVIDEVRLLSKALTSEQIITEYNNQNDPNTFYSVGAEETTHRFVPSNPFPPDGSTNQPLIPQLSIQVNDTIGGLMNVTFLTNASTENWHTIGVNISQPNGTYYCSNTSEFSKYNTKYWWAVNVSNISDSGNWTNTTFHFITKSELLTNPYDR